VPAQWIALAVATLAAAMGLGLLLGLDGCSHPSASIRLGRRSRDAGLCLLLRACAQRVALALRVWRLTRR
jgi:hypothetical protein